MTEADWLTCADPQPMLTFLLRRAGPRKLRLFAAACCRRIWTLLTDERSRAAVGEVERYADGLADYQELLASHGEAGVAAAALTDRAGDNDDRSRVANAAHAALAAADPPDWFLAPRGVVYAAAEWAAFAATDYTAEAAAQADLLRCL